MGRKCRKINAPSNLPSSGISLSTVLLADGAGEARYMSLAGDINLGNEGRYLSPDGEINIHSLMKYITIIILELQFIFSALPRL